MALTEPIRHATFALTSSAIPPAAASIASASNRQDAPAKNADRFNQRDACRPRSPATSVPNDHACRRDDGIHSRRLVRAPRSDSRFKRLPTCRSEATKVHDPAEQGEALERERDTFRHQRIGTVCNVEILSVLSAPSWLHGRICEPSRRSRPE